MSLEIKHLYRFGEFTLDKKERVLKRGEDLITLTPKAFELLTLLVENSGKLLEKENLIREIWADSFVEESNLTFNIGQLRKVLGDRPQHPSFIQTVPRHGYRFIAEVTEIVEEESIPEIKKTPDFQITEAKRAANFADKQAESPQVFSKSTFFAAALIILLVISVVVASIIWGKFKTVPTAPILTTDFKSDQLTNAGGVFEAVISPDGKMMAYLNGFSGKSGIWLRQLETGENTQLLPDSDDAYYGLAFSKDGRELYFSRGPRVDEARKINIYRVSVLGGIPKEVVGGVQSLFSLSPDNRQISFVRCLRQDADFCSLFIADIDGKNEKKLLTRPRPIRMNDNQFSPDGKSIAVAVGQTRSSSSEFGLVEVDIENKTEREITDHKFTNIKYLQWLPDKSGILVTAYEPPNNAVKIFRVSTQTNEIQLLTKDSISYDSISLDSAAGRMVTTQVTANFRLWTASLAEPDKAKPISQAAPPMYYGQNTFVFAPDGNIVYASGSDSNQHIWTMNTDGTNQRQLTSGQGTNWQPRLSPDQSYIFFSSNRTGSGQIWRMNIDGSNQTQISEGTAGSRPIFISADGKTIYYESARDSTLGKITIDGDGKTSSGIISNERMSQPQINQKEDTVVYFSRKANQRFEIALMSLADGKIIKSFPLGDEKSLPVKVVWSPDGKSLFYLTESEKKFLIWRLSPETGKSEMFADMGEEEITDFSLSPDRKSFAFIRGKEFHDAFLIEGLR